MQFRTDVNKAGMFYNALQLLECLDLIHYYISTRAIGEEEDIKSLRLLKVFCSIGACSFKVLKRDVKGRIEEIEKFHKPKTT